MIKYFFWVFPILLAFFSVNGQSYNTELLSNVRFPDNSANIWGYADKNGKEYAIIGRVTGTSIFDVTDGRNPKLLKHIVGTNSSWREIKSHNDRIYVVADRGADGVLIINMSNAQQDIPFTFWKPIVSVDDKILTIKKAGTIDRSHALFIDEKGYCYLTGSNFHSGVVVLDLNKNADNPEFVGIFNPNYSHDGFARNDTFWSADIIAGEFTVWDVKDKKNPKKLANQRTGNTFTHNIWLSDDGKYAFTTDERANAFVESYDISNLGNITLLDKYRSRTTQIRGTIPHNVIYHKGFLHTSYYTDGFTIIDASKPEHLVEVAAFDTYPAGEEDFHGCWGVYPFLPSGNILASDIEFGLFVLKPQLVKASYVKGLVVDSLSGKPIANALVKIIQSSQLEVSTNANGLFKSGGPYSGLTKFTVSIPGYQQKIIELNLKTGMVLDTTIKLKALTTKNIKIKVLDAKTKQSLHLANILIQRENEIINKTTDTDGLAIAPVFEGKYGITIGKWGYKYYAFELIPDSLLTVELQRGYEDDFIFNYDWTAQSTTFAGVWGRAEPRGAYILEKQINPEYDFANDLGSECMITGNGSTSVFASDVDRGYTRLISPRIDLSTYNKPILEFYAWTARLLINTDAAVPLGQNAVYIISGTDTVMMDPILTNKPEWTRYAFNINKEKLKDVSNVYIMFEANEPIGAEAQNVLEFGVDAIKIRDDNSTAIASKKLEYNLEITPNPWTTELHIQFKKPFPNSLDLFLINANGQSVFYKKLTPYTKGLHISPPLSPGIYFIQIKKDQNILAVQKVIKSD